ncbi:PAS domain-containing hybrid sensor histidine kinase/response regulator [Rubripirellula reticaptiva]|uniref:histidine kinase n=1 Tax=Rubripirellula reticaptiva TaxID=2528013 RepID=A0A5C6ESB0_9BACT|nr:PAS domain-containing hybrid sensor histidine kinase/response regulator [Rubripirellula reticaptiva]TWU51244.1 Autoinducer 2 sensor kinase/phosphatase LuxQ [Rubripirellula reticaptiva]
MSEFFPKFFDTSDFPARWYCGNWSEFLGWLHIVSDVATFAAYFAIPAVLIYFVRKRDDFPFHKLFWLFGGFILACGTVHLIEAIIFWHPIYRVSAMMKVITAMISWATVIALVRYMPRILQLPSIAATNERLKTEISQRQQTERELREAKERHDAILAGTSSIVWTTDRRGQFAKPQISWERYTGQNWDEHKGLGWAEAIHEDDLPELKRRWQISLSNGTKHQATGRIWHQESQAYRAFIAEAVPVKNDDGTMREWVGTITDIEEQEQAQAALGLAKTDLVKQKRELELIYEATPVGLSLIDRNYRFLRVNETLASINGYSVEQHIGARSDEMLPELHEQLYPIYDQIFATSKPILNVEIVGKTPASDQEKTWLASYFPLELPSDDGTAHSVTAVSAIVQDITDRKETERRLQQSEAAALAASRSKSEFLANMSHEIRTPMAAILGYADVLLGHLKDPDNRNCVLIMKRNGEHLLELINDILDLSRIEAGKLDVEPEACPLPQLVADIQSLMQVRAGEKKVKFEVEFEGQVPGEILTDATRLRQVLINLIGNAIKFTDEGEVTLKVKFVAEANPPLVEFAIVDTGIGISPEQQERLFKPFSQGDSSVTRQYGGSGLGLAISQRLVQMLDGTMELESEPGEGSTFFVRLPVDSIDEIELVRPDLVIRRSEPEELLSESPKLDCRVLVVDDRRDVRHISQHFLEKAGARVATAEDGQQGIDEAIAARDAGQPFDLIVMDMQMPNVDGLQATARLRSAGIELPIVALTADAMKGDRDKCLNGGCDDYLSKPIDHAKLVNMVAKYTQQVTAEELVHRRRDRAEQLRKQMGDSNDA